MNMLLQNILVGVIIAVAGFFLFKRFCGRGKCKNKSCNGCNCGSMNS